MKKPLFVLIFLLSVHAASASITLSSGIKVKLREKIEKDLTVLNNFKFQSADKEFLKMLGLSTLDSTSATDWLHERVNYILEDNALSNMKMIMKKAVTVEKENVIYPNPNIIPYSLDPKNSLNDESENMIAMSNVGVAIYTRGKQDKVLYNLKVSKGLLRKPLKVSVVSPRTGIIQIGEGLFSRDMTINNQKPDSLANTINRLSTFFHEARHSDGNGTSLGFAHAVCPKGHDLEGRAACDENLNGPYMIKAKFIEAMIKSSENLLTERERETLKIVILDNMDRVLKKTNSGLPSIDWDAKPEALPLSFQ